MRKKLFFLIITLSFFSLPAYGEEGALFSKIGIHPITDRKEAPDFCLEGVHGEKVQLKALKGKIVLLNFWATWCGPCKEEMPSMEALHQRYKERDFVLLTISVDYGGLEPVRKFLKKHHYGFPVLLDPTGKTLDLFEVNKIPAALLLDKKGKMIGRVIGPRDWTRPEVSLLIDQMLQDGPSKVVSLKNRKGISPFSTLKGHTNPSATD